MSLHVARALRVFTVLLALSYHVPDVRALPGADIAAAAATREGTHQGSSALQAASASTGDVPIYMCLIVSGNNCARSREVLMARLAKDLRQMALGLGIRPRGEPEVESLQQTDTVSLELAGLCPTAAQTLLNAAVEVSLEQCA